MAQYINKDALVAEIEKRRNKNARNKLNIAATFEDNYLISFIDTIETKEVDLEKEIKKYIEDNIHGYCMPGVEETAKHFYELGLKAQNENKEMVFNED